MCEDGRTPHLEKPRVLSRPTDAPSSPTPRGTPPKCPLLGVLGEQDRPPASRPRPPVDKSQQPRMSLLCFSRLLNPLDAVLRVSPLRGPSRPELPGASSAPGTAAVQGRLPAVWVRPPLLVPGLGTMSLRVWLQDVHFKYQNMKMFSLYPLVCLGGPLYPIFIVLILAIVIDTSKNYS